MRFNIQRLKAAGLDVQIRDDVIEIFGQAEVPRAIIQEVRARISDPFMVDYTVDAIANALVKGQIMSLAE